MISGIGVNVEKIVPSTVLLKYHVLFSLQLGLRVLCKAIPPTWTLSVRSVR